MNHTEIIRYQDILRDFDGFDDWLKRLGVPVQLSDRGHNCIRLLQKAERAFQNGLDGEAAHISKSEYLFGLTEALELHDVYLAFRSYPSQELRTRLIRALSGPTLPEAETAKNRDGRNIMFELALGAEWTLCGRDVELQEPDLLLRTPPRNYFVACKRPEHEHGIRAAVKDAARQLREVLHSASADYFGLIAISLSRVLNHGNKFFSGNYEQLSLLLNELMSVQRNNWRTVEFHPRNVAVMFHAHTPADWGSGLFRLSAARIGPVLTEEAVHTSVRDDLTMLYPAQTASPQDISQ